MTVEGKGYEMKEEREGERRLARDEEGRLKEEIG